MLGNIALGVSALHALYANRTLLPKALRPHWLLEIGTLLCGFFFIGISLVVIGVAAFNLLLDFDFIERGSDAGAPKAMEWYGAFGLLVTLVWLYISILRLLSKLQRD